MTCLQISLLAVLLIGIFQAEEIMADPMGQCCKKVIHEGVTYTAHSMVPDDTVLNYGCLSNCAYRRPGSIRQICFKSGHNQPLCSVPSDNFKRYKEESLKTFQEVDDFLFKKTQEYQKLEFKTLKEKLLWMQSDIQNYTGKSFTPDIRVFIKDELQQLNGFPILKNQTEKLISDLNVISVQAVQADKSSSSYANAIQALNDMEAELLSLTQKNELLDEATHQGIQAVRFSLDFFNSSSGTVSSKFKNLYDAIMYNTEYSGVPIESLALTRNSDSWGDVAKGCAVRISTGAVSGAVGGCLAGLIGGLPGCKVGAITGAIGGAFGGIAYCLHQVIDKALGCFAPTSQVETPLGLKDISELVIGDLIRTSSGGLSTHFTEVYFISLSLCLV